MAASGDWTAEACRELAGRQTAEGGWGYRTETSPRAEPTALAALALLAVDPCAWTEPVARASSWLLRAQRGDGSVAPAPGAQGPGWMTADALLVWCAAGAPEPARRRASDWLLRLKGKTVDPAEDPAHVAGHDTTLVGWPWVADTHSWVEPTALAVLALGRAGSGSNARVTEGLELLRNRAVEAGGWNYGNKSVFGTALRPQPGPTGVAMLALAGTGPRDHTVDRAVRYLARALPRVRAASSLGWGVLGLRAWGERPGGAADWLAESYRSVRGRPDAAPRLAALLLGAARGSLGVFGRDTAPA